MLKDELMTPSNTGKLLYLQKWHKVVGAWKSRDLQKFIADMHRCAQYLLKDHSNTAAAPF